MWWVSAFGGKTVWRVAAIAQTTEESGIRLPTGFLARVFDGSRLRYNRHMRRVSSPDRIAAVISNVPAPAKAIVRFPTFRPLRLAG